MRHVYKGRKKREESVEVRKLREKGVKGLCLDDRSFGRGDKESVEGREN